MKNRILKAISLVSILIYTANANTPSEISSYIHIDKDRVAYKDSLHITVELNDIMFKPVRDAYPKLIFDGNTSNINYSMRQDIENKNLYFFTLKVEDSETHSSQDVNITIKGKYVGEPYIFKEKMLTIYFQ